MIINRVWQQFNISVTKKVIIPANTKFYFIHKSESQIWFLIQNEITKNCF